MEEIWKDIKGYEGYYQISNLGNIKSLNRIIENKGAIGGKYKIKGKNRSQNISKTGYYICTLCKKRKRKNF